MRSRPLVVATIGLALVVLPASAALAEATDVAGVDSHVTAVEIGRSQAVESSELPHDLGIGEPHSVECTGEIEVTLIDLEGNPVPGGVTIAAGQQLNGPGSVTVSCGAHSVALLNAPPGYAAAGATLATVVVRPSATTPMMFEVDPIEVLGAEFTRAPVVPGATVTPAATPAPVPPTTPTESVPPATSAAPTAVTGAAPPTLPETGADDPVHLLLLALSLTLAGLVLVRFANASVHAQPAG